MFGSNSLVKRFKQERYPYMYYRIEDIGHEVSESPMNEFLPEIEKFITDLILDRKQLMIDISYKDKMKNLDFLCHREIFTNDMQKFLEKYLLPIAMFLGIAFHKHLSVFSPFLPLLLAIMLFISYCRIGINDVKLTKFHYILLAIQYIGSALIYIALRPVNEILAQAVMICVLTATATSAPVVAGLLEEVSR